MITSAGLYRLEYARTLLDELETHLGASETALLLLAQADTLLEAVELVCFAEFRHPELVAEITARVDAASINDSTLETRTQWIREQLADLLL